MRVQLDYLRAMCSVISLEGTTPFQPAPLDPAGGHSQDLARFLDVPPPVEFWRRPDPPFVIAHQEPSTPEYDGRRRYRFDPEMVDGKKILKFLRRQFRTVDQWRLDFWLRTPESEALSSNKDRGIRDQVLIYIATNRRILGDEGDTIVVRPGGVQVVTDPAKSSGLYKLSIKVMFAGGIYTGEDVPGLAGSEFGVSTNLG